MRNIIINPVYIKIVVRRYYKLVTKRKKERKKRNFKWNEQIPRKKYNLVKLTQEKK